MKNITLLGLGLLASGLAFASPPRAVAPLAPGALEFVANRHQWATPVLFAADVPTGRLYLERGRLVQSLCDGKQLEELHHKSAEVSDKQRIRAHAYATTFVGANPRAAVQGQEKLPGYSNFFIGNDKSHWASEVPGYADVRYAALYPGIDLHFYSKQRVLEYDFEVAAGADAARIALRYDGQTNIRVVNGALHVSTTVGTVVEQRPYAYQLVDGKQQPVACAYVLKGNTVSFAFAKGYNHALPLVIDPVLVYSTYTGSTSNYGYTATYDSAGNLYAGGTVFGAGYPTTLGAFDVSFNTGTDMGIMKFNPSAATGPASRVYATYVGGSSDDHPHSLVVDQRNNLIIMGSTGSSNYPTTTGAYDTSLGGGADIVLTKLNASGSALVGSTYLGGTGIDGRNTGATNTNYGDTYRGDVTVDRSGSIYVASVTASTNFPVVSAGFQTSSGGGASDGVVCKLNPALTSLVWSNYLGGSGVDVAYSVALDSVNNVFVSGGTSSRNFPGTTGGFRNLYQGGTTDGFVARISAVGDDLVQSTYIGTSLYDQAHFVQLNKRGEVYTYGQTLGTYPVTPGVYSNPGSRQFIQKLNPRLTAGVYSTVIGNGSGTGNNLSPTAFLVDNCGQVVISGWTSQGSMPITANALQSSGGSGTTSTGIGAYFYIGQLSANAATLVYGTYFGNGNCHVDGGTSRFDKKGVIYQSMCAGSGTGLVRTTPNAWSATNPAGYNNAAFKIDVLQLDAVFVPALTASSLTRQVDLCAPAQFFFNRPTTTGTGTRWDFGNGQTSVQANNVSTIYQNPGRYPVRLTVFDPTNCLQSVTAVDTVVVYAAPQPRAAASARQTICVGSSATISATNQATLTPNVTYTWTAPGQPSLTGPTVTVQPTATTRYTVTIRTPANVGGCSATDTVTVRVLSRLLVSAGPPQTICGGAAATLRVADFGPGATYTWTAPGQPTLSGQSVSVSPATSVRYRVNIVNASGCQGRDSVQLTVAPRPTVAVTASAPNIVNRPVTFGNTTTGATAYRWNFGDGSPDSVSTDASPAHTYARPNINPGYLARLTVFYGPNGSCQEARTVLVPVRGFDLPNVITPPAPGSAGDGFNDSFRPFVSAEKVDIQIFNRWGRKVFEQANYVDGWGSGADVAAGVYYYRLVSASGETWKGWLEVVR